MSKKLADKLLHPPIGTPQQVCNTMRDAANRIERLENHVKILKDKVQPQRCGDCGKLLPDGHPHGYCNARDEPDYF